MAFMDKLGQVANKVGAVAGDTLDYGKNKGKIVLEKGKIKDAKELLGTLVYEARKYDQPLDEDMVRRLCEEIETRTAVIEALAEEARQRGEDISDAFRDAAENLKGGAE